MCASDFTIRECLTQSRLQERWPMKILLLKVMLKSYKATAWWNLWQGFPRCKIKVAWLGKKRRQSQQWNMKNKHIYVLGLFCCIRHGSVLTLCKYIKIKGLPCYSGAKWRIRCQVFQQNYSPKHQAANVMAKGKTFDFSSVNTDLKPFLHLLKELKHATSSLRQLE